MMGLCIKSRYRLNTCLHVLLLVKRFKDSCDSGHKMKANWTEILEIILITIGGEESDTTVTENSIFPSISELLKQKCL